MRYLSIILLFVLASCHKSYYDYMYEGESNYKKFYVVDTITIDNPVIFHFGSSSFATSQQNLNDSKIDDKFVARPDVFIVGFNLFFDLPKVEDIEKFRSYKDEGGCDIRKDTSSAMVVYKFNNRSVRFILALINVNYYNKNYNTYYYYQIKMKEPKNAFYKIVYPLCQ